MRTLVTGATGFLGRYVISAAISRGHEVTALVRPSRELTSDFFPEGVTISLGDVRDAGSLPAALQDVDAVIHLAACVVGDDDAQFTSTVVGTENLLATMIEQNVQRLVHCSTFSVYDWQRPAPEIHEDSALEHDLYARDGYAISKMWQERIVRRTADSNDWKLTILRPGFIWGADHELIAGIGQSFGRLHVVFGAQRAVPLTYVENCADCFVTALESEGAVGKTFNVVDSERITAWQYMGACIKTGAASGWRVYVPYWFGLVVARLSSWTSRLLFGPRGRLPGLLVPIKFRARFRPLEFPNRKLREQLCWQPQWSFQAAWRRAQSGERNLLTTQPFSEPQAPSEPEVSLV